MRIIATLAASAALFITSAAQAAVFNYDISFDGTNVIINPGSDTPAGSSFAIGDSFSLTFSATGNSFWRVLSDYDAFVPLSFSVAGSGTRTADIDTQFLLDGAVVNSTMETGVSQASVHIGAQNFDLNAGLEFDTITLNWELTALSDAALATVINDVVDVFSGFGQNGIAPFFRANAIEFVTDAAVPLPGAALLFGSALVAGAAARRRKTTKTA